MQIYSPGSCEINPSLSQIREELKVHRQADGDCLPFWHNRNYESSIK